MLVPTVLGHSAVQQRFSTLVQQQQLPHAWMLYGQQGMGKAMLAQALAQTYLCESLEADGQGCGQCHACQMVVAGSHPDLAYIGLDWDEKKKQFRRDISVSQIRHTLDFLALTGMNSQRRVVILDDANRMNMAAANALLKGLEEPPEGAILLMVCHELSALPETIRSRCMLEHCSPLQQQDVRDVLTRMALPQDVLMLAENLAKGCPGRVEMLRDETVATACLRWQDMTQSLQHADLGDMEAWLQKYIQVVPLALLVSILLEPLQETMQAWEGSYALSEKFYTAVQGILTWQHDVLAHALRPVPSLLVRILEVRKVCKQMG